MTWNIWSEPTKLRGIKSNGKSPIVTVALILRDKKPYAGASSA